MTRDVQDALHILKTALFKLDKEGNLPAGESGKGNVILLRAIRHLAYPDRDVYPKTRRGTKGAPIVRR